ncbi:preprotein translocase subunit SecG [Paracoccus sp. (in: a-proteobacteria)]|uniref:preprotein translocase subunit SecG n=1 Tax=Paracoccus sp. TaxID=267 RepID=UPI0026DF75C3|nr:preprotein translocase subunit SecG [Paracoccus sp. (in: a-proteobacteria)]MDO5648427.1 preprotein translocase subunit SecG [Paracoccus sp. (in: a-proteobacteria)]
MENVLLTVHLILAVLLTGVVLLQRSEGGGLGMGGGGGAGGVMTGRQAANTLTKLTWVFGIAIFCTSIGLTVMAARQATGTSIMDQLGAPAPATQTVPSLPTYTPPPATSGDPLTPPAPDAPAPAATAPAPAGDPLTPPPAN